MPGSLVLVLVLVLVLAAGGSTQQQAQQTPGACPQLTERCLLDDNCGPPLRLAHAFCYESPGASSASCSADCATALAALRRNSNGAALLRCDLGRYPEWRSSVHIKQAACRPLLPQADSLLRRVLAGQAQSDCWLAGLLCASRFGCRSLLLNTLQQCVECDADCGRRLWLFNKNFGAEFRAFANCLCGQQLADGCAHAAGNGSTRSRFLRTLSFTQPLDQLIVELGFGAVQAQTRDAARLLLLSEHSRFCSGFRHLIGGCQWAQAPPQPRRHQPLCRLRPRHAPSAPAHTPAHLYTSTTPSTTTTSATPSTTTPSTTTPLTTRRTPALRATADGRAAAPARAPAMTRSAGRAASEWLVTCLTAANLLRLARPG